MTTDIISARDARERAAGIYGEPAALVAYTNALQNGDDLLVDAIQQKAKERGWTSVSPDITSMAARLHVGYVTLVNDYNVGTAAIRDQLTLGQITSKYAMELQSKNAAGWVTQLDAIAQSFQTFIAGTRRGYDAAIGTLSTSSGDSNQQLINEMRIGRAWDRIKAELDAANKAGSSLVGTITARLSTADSYEIIAILAEASSYLSVHGEEDTHDLIQEALKTINPAIAEAAQHVSEAERLEVVVFSNNIAVRRVITDTGLQDADINLIGYVNPLEVDYR